MFSKYFVREEFGTYNMTINHQTGASAAAPTYFAPKAQRNAYGLLEIQVDGGIIANNPVLYAYEMATKLNHVADPETVRIISLGTGTKPFAKLTDSDITNWT